MYLERYIRDVDEIAFRVNYRRYREEFIKSYGTRY